MTRILITAIALASALSASCASSAPKSSELALGPKSGAHAPEPQATNAPEPQATNAPEPQATNAPEPQATNAPEPLPQAAGQGLLTLNARPWAQVYMDGTLIGSTPLYKREVPSGSRTLRLVTKDNKELIRVVHIKPGESLILTLHPGRP